jgi:hypothetical protein
MYSSPSLGSVLAVEAYVSALFNQVAALYQNESILTTISQIYVWTTDDPYTATTSSELLAQFRKTRTSFNGDLGQLLTLKNIDGLSSFKEGGSLCSSISYKYSVAGIDPFITSSFSPIYTWSVNVIAHEFGHLFGSHHTHACEWNGNRTAIDGCYPVEGTCADPGYPSGGGTIMSYCDLVPSVGVKFNLGFGPQPGNLIRNNYNNASCLQTTGILGAPVVCVDNSTYTLSSGTATWEVAPTSAFTFTSRTATSAVVKALDYKGTAGTLTAMVNNVPMTKQITTCKIEIQKSVSNCISSTYSLYPYQASTWSVSASSGFTMTDMYYDRVTINHSGNTAATTTLTAMIKGIAVTKTIRGCNDLIIDGSSSIYPFTCQESYSISNLPSGWSHPSWTIDYGLQSGLTQVSDGTRATFNKVTGGFYNQSASTLTATLSFSFALYMNGHYTTYEVSKPITLSKWTSATIENIKQGTTSVSSGYVGTLYVDYC